ncbi:hypothetical protein WJR50_26095 [Catalinimonas sp. 4WD22]|uniref:helix-turn-helix domain-containing protein n=1 Tax=Catalinimonas locisalis TaxID=3133978 RepID=UPI00310173F8
MSSVFIIGIIGVAFGLFAAYLLFNRIIKNPNVLNILPFVFILSISWILLVNTLNASGYIVYVPHLFRTALPLCFCLGPISYLYIRAYIRKEKKLAAIDILHFVPTLIAFADTLPFLLQSADEKKVLIQEYILNNNALLKWQEGTFFMSLLPWIVCIYGVIYILFCIKEVYRYSLAIEQKKSILTLPEFKWLISIIICDIIITLAFLWSLATRLEDPLAFNSFSLIIATTFLALNFTLYQTPYILYGIRVTPEALSNESVKKYNPFDDDELTSYVTKVKSYMKQHKPFLQNGYLLGDLSNDINVERHLLSIVINQGFGMRYTEMINSYRISYLIQNYQHMNYKNLTIEGLASEVGFKSRTTFLHSVKKLTGLTPTKFLKKLEDNQRIEFRSNSSDLELKL